MQSFYQTSLQRQVPRSVCWRCSLRFGSRRKVSATKAESKSNARTDSSDEGPPPQIQPTVVSGHSRQPAIRTETVGHESEVPDLVENGELAYYPLRITKHYAFSATFHKQVPPNTVPPPAKPRMVFLGRDDEDRGAQGRQGAQGDNDNRTQRLGRPRLQLLGSKNKDSRSSLHQSAGNFSQRILGLINDETKAMDVLARQKLHEKHVLKGIERGGTARKLSTSCRDEQQVSDSPRAGHFARRSFLLSARYKSAEALLSELAGHQNPFAPIPESSSPGEKKRTREYLAAWQGQQDKIETEAKLAVGIATSSLPSQMVDRTQEPLTCIEGENMEHDHFDVDNSSVDEATKVLQPGDLVEMVVDNKCLLMIFVQRLQSQLQFLTHNGRWLHTALLPVLFFTRPGFCNRRELDTILPFMPTQDVALHLVGVLNNPMQIVSQSAAQSLVRKIEDFIRQADEVYRQHADKIDNAYELLAHDKEFTWMNINDIAARVLRMEISHGIPDSTVWAVHRSILLYNMGFVPDFSHWKTETFEILSKQDMDLVNQIKSWVREHQEYSISRVHADKNPAAHRTRKLSVLAEFAKSMRPIIEKSRAFRRLSQTGYIGASTVQIGPSPSAYRSVAIRPAQPSETLILRFLEMWSARKSVRGGSALTALGPMILRASGLYADNQVETLNEKTGFNFLQEAGVIAPWETRASFDTRLALPGMNFNTKTDRLMKAAAESAQTFEPEDSMKHLRHDWGNLEVFCIDDLGTQEVDDGVSLEAVAGEDSVFWIHCHVANPTAFIPTGHAMAAYAEQMCQTAYLPGTKYSMLPAAISTEHFSLAPGRPVLTFSAKLNLEGDLLQIRITPSRIHNVTRVTPATVYEHLTIRHDRYMSKRKYTVGHAPPPRNEETPNKHTWSLTRSQVEKLKLISLYTGTRRMKGFEFMNRNTMQRAPDTTHYVFRRSPKASLCYYKMEHPWRRVLRRIEGDPTIQFEATVVDLDAKQDDHWEEAAMHMNLVMNVMLLAGEVGASWSAARGIPLIYRGTAKGASVISPESRRLRAEAGQPGQKVAVSLLAAEDQIAAAPGAISSIRPCPNQHIGSEAYSKVTSPMRRYGDMTAHWQIEAALRSEARLGRDLTERDISALPFSNAAMEAVAKHIGQREMTINRAISEANLHWCHLLVMRGLQFHEPVFPDPFPEFFDVFVLTQRRLYWFGKIMQLGMFCRFSVADTLANHGNVVARGDRWKARISHSQYNERSKILIVEIVELISRL